MRIRDFTHTDWQAALDRVAVEIQPFLKQGAVADYIPALAAVDPDSFAMAVTTVHGETFTVGDADQPFSIQSISKVFALVVALELEGEAIWDRVGREPSGSPFNSIVQLEQESGKPRNPFINPGAIVVTDSVAQHCGSSVAAETVLSFIHRCTDGQEAAIDAEVAASEKAYGDRNRALAYFMKSFDVIQGDVDCALDSYFHQCAITMSTADLSRAGLFLAAGGMNPLTGTRMTTHKRVDRVNALMMLCGHYDMSGDFAFRVGLAGKSGVGGGIMAVIPEVGCVAVWSPRLNAAGNSLAGTEALERFSHATNVNLF